MSHEMRSDAQNLKVISEAIEDHKQTCTGKLLAVLMNPFEVKRLGWDEIKGIPIKPDDKIGTGRFRLLCDGVHDKLQGVASKQADDTADKGAPVITPVPETLPEVAPEIVPIEPALV